MNRLKRDQLRFLRGMLVVAVCFMGLGLLKLVQWICGFEEQKVYTQYPAGGYVAVTLGIGFILGLIYSVKKALDTHPTIQLRRKPDDILQNVLADPEYASWHEEARRLLDKRHGT